MQAPVQPKNAARSEPTLAVVVVAHADRIVRDQIVQLLSQDGHLCLHMVQNGGEAVRAALIALPQAVVLDSDLPGMDGVATLAALRAHGITCPVVVLDERQAGTQAMWKACGFAGHVASAEGLGELAAFLRRLLVPN